MNVGMSECCLSGTINGGMPQGTVRNFGGLDTYIAEPENHSHAKAIIFLVDIFGYTFPNIRLLADNYAKAGFVAYIPDIHRGDSLPIELLKDIEPPLADREARSFAQKAASTAKVGATLGPWLVSHGEAVTKPLIEDFIREVRRLPSTERVGVIGFCWGGRYAILTAQATEPNVAIDAAYACHPSLVAIPEDFDLVVRPLSLGLGEKDSLLGEKEVDQIRGIMKGNSSPSEIKVYEDQVHGFALRGDWSSDKDKEAMNNAEKQGIKWFNKYLGDQFLVLC